MNKLLLAATALLLSFNARGEDIFKYDEPVSLVGTLSSVKSKHPSPEFRGKDQPSILLDASASVVADDGNDEFNVTEKDVKIIQLAYDENHAAFIKKNKGKRVKVSCDSLFHSHTGHHTTKVLCLVDGVGLY